MEHQRGPSPQPSPASGRGGFTPSPLWGEGWGEGPAQLAARVQALVDFYHHVQTERMVGIPLLNPALSVEAVGFEWAGGAEEGSEPVAEGVLITPWFMSLLRLPAVNLPHGNRVTRSFVREFGSERFDFIGAHDPAVGYHETCALFSPMNGFTSQDLARETALASLALTRAAPPEPITSLPAPSALSARRAFLFGRRGAPAP